MAIVITISVIFFIGMFCILASLFEKKSEHLNTEKFMNNAAYKEEFQKYLDDKNKAILVVSPNVMDLV